MERTADLKRVVIEVFGGCNYTCKMCPQTTPGREASFLRKMPLDLFEDILDQITPKYGTPLINLEGSGEPTQAKDLPLYIEACTKRGLKSYIYSNGTGMHGDYMKDCVDAGLGLFRFSVIGYNRETYKEWMNADNFDMIYQYAGEMRDYISASNSKCELHSYHLILDPNKVEWELNQYLNNFVNKLGIYGYVWMMHNWSGNFNTPYTRDTSRRRTCGRPAADELTVRAGGLKGHRAAVTPCCQVLGPPTESKSVLGHLDTQTFEQVYWGEAYETLRKLHAEERFDEIPYCKDCDFLYDDPEVLVWSNHYNAGVGKMIGVEVEINN